MPPPQLQSFRSRSPDLHIDIHVHHGPSPADSFVLWSDIQIVFQHAQYIKHANTLVPFLVDSNNHWIEPRRIAHYPGVVLEVVTTSNTRPSLAREVTSLELMGELQQVRKKQGETLELQRRHTINQEEMLELQKRTLDTLAVMQSHARALLTQTYELHEYPIPRLFIVLPKAAGLRNRLTGLFCDQFRLYFLCECGTHTMLEGTKTRHEVHLAKHEGYDLERPKEFFEKYGSYVNIMLCMIKYGITAGSIVVPPLANLKILEGLDTVQKHMNDLKKTIAPLVDDTINLLEDFKSKSALEDELSSNHTEFDRLEALEGADLRQLESYLKVRDQGRTLSNLYRIVTSEGHVKWVCLDHYRANYRESTMNHLREAAQTHQGAFIEETGSVDIEIRTSVQAQTFYKALVNARGVQELKIKLGWDATMDDLRMLSETVTKANVVHLTVDGSNFKGSAINIVTRGRRYDPILKVASNTRLQSLQLVGFDDFFSRVSKYKSPTPKLRVFSIECKAHLDEKSTKGLNGFLQHCSGLTTLKMKFHQQYPTAETLMTTIPKIHQLETFRVDYGRFSLTTSLQQDKAQDTSITIPDIGSIIPEDLKFIHQVQFSWLVIETVPPSNAEAMLADILRHCQGPTGLRIEGKVSLDASAEDMKLLDLMKLFESTTSSNLESLSIDYGRFAVTANISKGRVGEATIRFDQLDDLTPDDLQFIQQGPYGQLTIEHATENEERLVDILHQSPVFSYRLFRYHIGHCLIATTIADMGLQDLMTLTTSEASNGLESFSVGCRGVALTGGFSEGKMQDASAKIERLCDMNYDDLRALHHGHLVQLVINSIPLSRDEERLADILRQNPMLTRLQIQHQSHSAMDTTPELSLQTLSKLVTLKTLSELRLVSINNDEFVWTANISQSTIQDIVITIKRLDILTQDDLKFIQQGFFTHLVLECVPQKADADRLSGILRHCPDLSRLEIKLKEEADFAQLDTIFQNVMDIVNMGTLMELKSFVIDYKNVPLTANIAQGRIQDIALTVERLSDIDSDTIKTIHQGRLTRLAIKYTPLEEDDIRLTEILHDCPSLCRLQIGCRGIRSLAIINLVIATREKILTQGDSHSLSTFELMDEGLEPFDVLALRSKFYTPIQSHLSFSKGSKSFEMRTWVRLQMRISITDPIFAFIRQFGWSIVHIDGFIDRTNLFEGLLNNILKPGTSQLESLTIHSRDSDDNRSKQLDSIIQQSPNFKHFGLYVTTRDEKRLQDAALLLNRYGAILSKMVVFGNRADTLSGLASSFPTRKSFPVLGSFEMWPDSGTSIPPDVVSWIVAMVSAPPQTLVSSSTSQPLLLKDINATQNAPSGSESALSWTPLKKVLFRFLSLQREEWNRVIEAMDVSALEHLDFWTSNIAQEQFERLVDRIAGTGLSCLPLKTILIEDSGFYKTIDSETLNGLVARLRTKAPM
ncbi:hypothetical protein BGX34_002667, partial [Mortierella sp. NVP85]